MLTLTPEGKKSDTVLAEQDVVRLEYLKSLKKFTGFNEAHWQRVNDYLKMGRDVVQERYLDLFFNILNRIVKVHLEGEIEQMSFADKDALWEELPPMTFNKTSDVRVVCLEMLKNNGYAATKMELAEIVEWVVYENILDADMKIPARIFMSMPIEKKERLKKLAEEIKKKNAKNQRFLRGDFSDMVKDEAQVDGGGGTEMEDVHPDFVERIDDLATEQARESLGGFATILRMQKSTGAEAVTAINSPDFEVYLDTMADQIIGFNQQECENLVAAPDLYRAPDLIDRIRAFFPAWMKI